MTRLPGGGDSTFCPPFFLSYYPFFFDILFSTNAPVSGNPIWFAAGLQGDPAGCQAALLDGLTAAAAAQVPRVVLPGTKSCLAQ